MFKLIVRRSLEQKPELIGCIDDDDKEIACQDCPSKPNCNFKSLLPHLTHSIIYRNSSEE